MPTAFSFNTFQDLGRAIEFSSADETRLQRTLSMRVGNGEALIYAITGAEGALQRPLHHPSVFVDMKGPDDSDWKRVHELEAPYSVGMLKQPTPGMYKFRIRAYGEHNVSINAVALRNDPKSKLEWFGCNACKKALKAVIIALILGLTEQVGWILPAFEAIKSWFRRAMEMTEGFFRELLDFLSDMITEPIEQIMEKVCRRLGFCP